MRLKFLGTILAAALLVSGAHGFDEDAASGGDDGKIDVAALLPEPADIDPSMKGEEYREYERETLFDYINGGAEIYLDLGFVKVGTREYFIELEEETWFTLDVYDMGRPESAFGIFRIERYGDVQKIDAGVEGYMAGGAAYFWSRRCYVKISSDDDSDAVARILEKMAGIVSSRIGDPGGLPPALKLFPSKHRVPSGEKYAARNLMGVASLKGYSCLFRNEKEELTLHLGRYDSEKDAGKTEQDLIKRLRLELQPEDDGEGARFSGKYVGHGWIKRIGPYLAVAQGLSGDPEKDGWRIEVIKAFHKRVHEKYMRSKAGDALDSLIREGGKDK